MSKLARIDLTPSALGSELAVRVGTFEEFGEPMLVYLYTITNMLGPGNHGVTKNWISAADGHLRQSESEIDLDLGTGKRVQSKTTVSYYDYDVGITIERPSL